MPGRLITSALHTIQFFSYHLPLNRHIGPAWTTDLVSPHLGNQNKLPSQAPGQDDWQVTLCKANQVELAIPKKGTFLSYFIFSTLKPK